MCSQSDTMTESILRTQSTHRLSPTDRNKKFNKGTQLGHTYTSTQEQFLTLSEHFCPNVDDMCDCLSDFLR